MVTVTLRVEQDGFKAFLRTNIVLTAGEHLPIDVKLELGASADSSGGNPAACGGRNDTPDIPRSIES